ncbi:SpoIIE family protein phosphatase [Kineosporia succinea]|uniref:Light-regulated signal transduction histidine kinase (Bacteriophytochrome) n=1 Tax=Kineosporia succinea TaxID=84632 RepID=A0ABT9P7P7_9ACTN|nr:SpoIIE family protein phosphatase [Kineosporia succinea]MDP9828698.1 light-regulated signal transduction histidine kinase (bacteriophytochrome) [Kineosporia succinea]
MTFPEADLDQCAREPIQYPGSVQPHGVMMVVHPTRHTVLTASENLRTFLPGAQGPHARDLLGHELWAGIEERVADDDLLEPVRWQGPEGGPWAGRAVDVLVHRSGPDRLVIELEAVSDASLGRSVSLSATRTQINRLRGATDVFQQLVSAVQRVTGFDRVMVYRFDREWNGEVIAEHRRDYLEPFLGLRYPESDIPAQARQLYTLNRLRFIVDSHAGAARLVPQLPADGLGELDLSFAPLRSVSPVHLEYLRGMGVRASMSVSMMRGGVLWGLVACHHYAGPLQPSHDERAAADFLTQAAMEIVTTRETSDDAARLASGRRQVEALLPLLAQPQVSPVRALAGADLARVAGLADAAGVVVRTDDVRTSWGSVPEPSVADEIVRTLARTEGVPAFTDHLAPGLGSDAVAGALVLPLAPRTWILWLNPAVDRTVRWAGDPHDKTITIRTDGTARIGPRKSFAAAEEKLRGRSAPWDSWQVQSVLALGTAAIGALRRYERDAVNIVEDLHDSLQPASLPRVADVDLEVRYVPAPDGRFAGDWWDCFELPGGRLALVVGDVTGHGSTVTATMTQLRTALRAYLLEGAPPAETLARLDSLAHLVFRPILATVVLALYDPATGAVEVARAGHPHPVSSVRGPVVVPARPPVGLGVEVPAGSWSGELQPGETLVLYSDGLSEDRRSSPEEGIARIAARVAEAAADPPATMADRLVADAPEPRTDDLTLLLARRRR